MLKNYFKSAFRSILKNKLAFLINIMGMSLSLAFSLMIFLYLFNEMSYEIYHDHRDRIYRLAVDTEVDGNMTKWAANAPAIAPALKEEVPEILNYVRLKDDVGRAVINYGDLPDFEVDRIYTADSSFFTIFTFPIYAGSITALEQPNSIVITKSLAQKIFGRYDVVGEILTINKLLDVQVTAVVEDPPSNTHIRFNGLISWNTFPPDEIWDDAHAYTYLLLPENHDISDFTKKVDQFVSNNPQLNAVAERLGMNLSMEIQPLGDIYLTSNRNNELIPNTSAQYLTTFICIALFFIISSSFNYINLSIASSLARAKEVGIRKVLGALSAQIRYQYLLESFIITLISFIIGLLLTITFVDEFSNLIGTTLDLALLADARLISLFVVLLLTITLLAGIYPSFYLSTFNPVVVLQSQGNIKNRRFVISKLMLTVQLGITIVMIVGSVVITSQLRFIQNTDLGFNKKNVLIVDIPFSNRIDYFKQELSELPWVSEVSVSSYHPLGALRDEHLVQSDKGDFKSATVKKIQIDHDFLSLLKIDVEQGRNFQLEFNTDSDHAFIVNESFVKYFNWENPIGKKIKALNYNKSGEVIGVVQDANLYSLHSEIQPIIISLSKQPYSSGEHLYIRMADTGETDFLPGLHRLYQDAFGELPLHWRYLEDEYNQLYSSDEAMGRMVTIGGGSMIVIACLGLYGLSTFFAGQQSREIGIRKVLGASYKNIFYIHVLDFIKLVGFASLISWPLSYFIMERWLDMFVAHVNIGLVILMVASILTLGMVISITGVHGFRLTRLNPVDVIRK